MPFLGILNSPSFTWKGLGGTLESSFLLSLSSEVRISFLTLGSDKPNYLATN